MVSTRDKINYNQIIRKVEDEIKKDDERWLISDRYKEAPRLPIDLFCSKEVGYDEESKQPKMDYHVFLVASVEQVGGRFQTLLSFCRFYLTFYVSPSPRDLKLTLAVSSDAEITNEKFYQENGFGLWIISKDKNSSGVETFEISKKVAPKPFRDKQKENFRKKFGARNRYLSKEEKQVQVTPKKLSDQLKEISSNVQASEYIARSFDEYIRDAGEAIMEYKPFSFEERFLDRKLLELNIELKHVLYGDELFNFLNEHLSTKDEDFKFCSAKLNELWCNYLDDRGYPLVHEKFEPLLQQLLPGYRDHFLHQYQDFLLGTYIMDGLLENGFLEKEKCENLSRGWLLASTFHDFSYCIQEYDKWSTEFFRDMFDIAEPLGSLELKRHYFENSFLSSIEHIFSELRKSLEILPDNEVDKLNDLRHFFYHQMTDRKNHAVISCLTLFKRFEKHKERDAEEFKNIFLPSGLAILLHDDEIWQTLNGYKVNSTISDDRWISDVREAKLLKNLAFTDCPLSFLLLLCDNIQDWGRPSNDEQFNALLKVADVRLKDLIVNGEGVKIQLYIKVLGKTKKFLRRKKNVLHKLEKLLSSSVPFVIEYWDSEKDEKTEYVFRIGGGSTESGGNS